MSPCTLSGICISNIIVFPTLIVRYEFSVSAFGAVLGLTDAVAQIACSQTLVALGAEFVATPLTIWLRGPESMPGASIRWWYDVIIIIQTA